MRVVRLLEGALEVCRNGHESQNLSPVRASLFDHGCWSWEPMCAHFIQEHKLTAEAAGDAIDEAKTEERNGSPAGSPSPMQLAELAHWRLPTFLLSTAGTASCNNCGLGTNGRAFSSR